MNNMLYKTVHNCKYLLIRNTFLIGTESHRKYTQTVDSTSSDSVTNLMRNRLIYQSRKRGILENCIIFSTFADKYLKTFDGEQLQKYDALINSEYDEWELYAWAIGSKPTPQEFDNDIMSLLKNHVHRQDHNSEK